MSRRSHRRTGVDPLAPPLAASPLVTDLRPTLTYFALAFAAIVAGLSIRFLPSSLPPYVVRYGGSCLWAAMVYFLIAALNPFRKVLTNAEYAAIFAAGVELFRLVHTPGLDAFRLTLAGALLLGRIFDPWHFAAYWIAILIVAVVDQQGIRRWRKVATARKRTGTVPPLS